MNIHLSPRLKEAFVLLGQGLSNKQIAQEMGIGEGTVKGYIDKIYCILKLTNTENPRIKAREIYSQILNPIPIVLNEKLGGQNE